jgi:hypothetical protein
MAMCIKCQLNFILAQHSKCQDRLPRYELVQPDDHRIVSFEPIEEPRLALITPRLGYPNWVHGFVEPPIDKIPEKCDCLMAHIDKHSDFPLNS